MKINTYAKYAWGILAYNFIVILWGAFVRASGSGAGCGNHWPTCNGQVIPQSPQIETIIEFTHRMMSGLSLIVIVILLIWGFRAYPKGSLVRLGAVLSMTFIITEALIGAGLVLFNWVTTNSSVGRTIGISLHLINTFLLLAFITLTAWWASGGKGIHLRGQGLALPGLGIGMIGVFLLGVSGAITALGDTLFPASSLAEGISQDLSPNVSFLIHLRIWHPVIAISLGFYLILVTALLSMTRERQEIKRFAWIFTSLFVLQLIAGLVNLFLLAPVWMQLVHLFLADTVWVTLILLTAMAFSDPLSRIEKAVASKQTPVIQD